MLLEEMLKMLTNGKESKKSFNQSTLRLYIISCLTFIIIDILLREFPGIKQCTG